MRLFRLWVPAGALAVVITVAGNALPQSMTESETTVTSVPGLPTVTSKTVTKKTVLNAPPAVVVNPPPPAVVINPPPASSETTTESTTSGYSAPTVEEKTDSKTTYSPFGVTHSETREKTTTPTDEDSMD
jgi:hypothetical protein